MALLSRISLAWSRRGWIRHLACLPIDARSKDAGRGAETRTGAACSGQTRPRSERERRAERRQRNRAASRSVRAPERPLPLIAVPAGVPQCVHGREGLARAQRPPALPYQAFAPQCGPARAEYGPAPLLGLVHHKRPPHERGKHPRQMVLARAVVVLTRIALLFQRVDRLLCALPPRPATAHEGIPVACTHPHVRPPTAVLPRRIADGPVRDAIAPSGCVRRLQGQGIDTAPARHEPRSARLSLIRGAAARLCGPLDLWEPLAMLPCFAPQAITEIVLVPGRAMRRIGTEAEPAKCEAECATT